MRLVLTLTLGLAVEKALIAFVRVNVRLRRPLATTHVIVRIAFVCVNFRRLLVSPYMLLAAHGSLHVVRFAMHAPVGLAVVLARIAFLSVNFRLRRLVTTSHTLLATSGTRGSLTVIAYVSVSGWLRRLLVSR